MGTFDQNSYTSFSQILLRFAYKPAATFLTCAIETVFVDVGVRLYSNEGDIESSLRSSTGYFISCFMRKTAGDVVDTIFPQNDVDNCIVNKYLSNIYLQILVGLGVAPIESKYNDDGWVNFLDNPGYQVIDKFLSGFWGGGATILIEGYEAYLLKEPIIKGVIVGVLRVTGAILLELPSMVYNAKFSNLFDQVTTSANDEVIESNVNSSMMANISLIAETPFWSNTTPIEGI